MYCNDCGLEIPVGSQVCPYCGTSTRIIDPHAVHRNNINGSKPEEPSKQRENPVPANGKPVIQTAVKKPTVQSEDQPKTAGPNTAKTPPVSSAPDTAAKKKTSAVSPEMIAALLAIATLIIGIPVIRSFGIQLPFDKSQTTPKPASETADSNITENEPVQTEDSVISTEEPVTGKAAAIFSNEAIDKAVCGYFNVKSTDVLSESDLSVIDEMSISADEIIINEQSFTVTSQIGDIDISEVAGHLRGLQTLKIQNAGTVSASGNGQMGFTKLTITDSKIVNNLQGIENAKNLKTLTIQNTDLSSLKYIAGCPALKKLNAPNNNISDIESLRGTDQITNITLYGNRIKDYTALSKIKTVNVWGKNFNADEPLSYVFEEMPDAYCFKVNVYNLHMRSEPSTNSTIRIRHIPQKYYIVLDQKKSGDITWYKVGNNAWVGYKEDWLTFYNN